uniref:CUB domain-containing protein n=1 Tax=Erpetoichthys calabaricus TaxID=27687 RepID=A0A8C4RUY9_ERPCA
HLWSRWPCIKCYLEPTCCFFSLPTVFGNEISGSSGQIASPLWPRPYPMNANYRWTITVAAGSFIRAQIVQMDIEDYYDCYVDKLKVKTFWKNMLSPILATVCGRELPGPVRSSGDSMYIEFISDGSVTRGGFNASYHKSEFITSSSRNLSILTFMASPSSQKPVAYTNASVLFSLCSGCGGLFHANRGVIMSPNYPQSYTPNLVCTYHVMVTSGFTVAVHFDAPFQVIGSGSTCTSGDYIEVRVGPLMISGLGETLLSCGRPSRNELLGESDSSAEGNGFKLTYEALSYGESVR